jgi:multidrug resistance protein, MATE family
MPLLLWVSVYCYLGIISFFSSLATGTHVIVARKFGAGDYKGCGTALNSSLLSGFTVGIVVAL